MHLIIATRLELIVQLRHAEWNLISLVLLSSASLIRKNYCRSSQSSSHGINNQIKYFKAGVVIVKKGCAFLNGKQSLLQALHFTRREIHASHHLKASHGKKKFSKQNLELQIANSPRPRYELAFFANSQPEIDGNFSTFFFAQRLLFRFITLVRPTHCSRLGAYCIKQKRPNYRR